MSRIRLTPPLHKYREFSHNTLDIIATDRLFFADPANFNDPLDVRPTLDSDLCDEDLELLFVNLARTRIEGELKASAQTLDYRGPRTIDHIQKQVALRTTESLNNIKWDVDNPLYDDEISVGQLLSTEIQLELVRRYEKGVVSLAERWDCPLMWSHYGDQHRGLCLGFSETKDQTANLLRVNYNGNRLVRASDVLKMVNGDAAAQERVDSAVLATKAQAWEYEREWRLIGRRGLRNSPLELSEITFGLRCGDVAKFTIMKTLEERQREIEYYEIFAERETFTLRRRPVDFGEISIDLPRVFTSPHELFAAIKPTNEG